VCAPCLCFLCFQETDAYLDFFPLREVTVPLTQLME
jgi:hypothetical protein